MKIITIEEHFAIKEVTEISGKNLSKTISKDESSGKSDDESNPSREELEDIAELRIQYMDESGIDMQVISYGSNNPQELSREASLELVIKANDVLAASIKKNPTRLAGLASLPVVSPKDAVNELERAVKGLGMKGAEITGMGYQGVTFDDSFFLPIFEKAAELNVPVYMHPSVINKNIADYYYKSAQWPDSVNEILSTSGYGWHIDSGILIIRMILSGIFDRIPNLSLISGHWGEFVPYYLERLDEKFKPSVTNLEQHFSEYYLKHIYITPGGMFSIPQLNFALDQMGVDHILYSGDYPYAKDTKTREFLENAPISDESKEKIGHINAEKLLGL
jgi:uncharacterized protein